jgi:protein-S-isoprenylcysteine O-methyltransferase Ste14
LPELNSSGGRAKLLLASAAIFALTTFYFIVSDQIPTWTIDSEIVVTAIAFLVFSGFFRARTDFQQKFGEDAYHRAVTRFALPGLAVLFAAIAHIAYMNGPKWPAGRVTLAMNILGIYWLIVGAVLWLRAVATFGIDNLTMMYVYFPQDGALVNSSIYSILRHPIYAAGLRIGLALALLNTSIYALSFMPFLALAFFSWIRLVEERELIQRFPDYEDYRRRVPAFFPKPGDFPKFISFLLTGN